MLIIVKTEGDKYPEENYEFFKLGGVLPIKRMGKNGIRRIYNNQCVRGGAS